MRIDSWVAIVKSASPSSVMPCRLSSSGVGLLVGGRQRVRRGRLHVDRAHRVAVGPADEALRVGRERHDREVVVGACPPTSSAPRARRSPRAWCRRSVTVWPDRRRGAAEQLARRCRARAPRPRRRCRRRPRSRKRPSVTLTGAHVLPARRGAGERGGPVGRRRRPATAMVVAVAATACDVGGHVRRRPAPRRRGSVSVEAEPKPPRTPVLVGAAAGRDHEQVGAELVDLVAAPGPWRPGRGRR